jgi:hypothetical protein
MDKGRTIRRSIMATLGLIAAGFAGCTLPAGVTGAIGAGHVNLGKAGEFVILAKTGVVSVPTSAVTGDIGLSPAATTYLTGFSQANYPGNAYATSPQVTGKIYCADMAAPTPIELTTAVDDMLLAYTDAATRILPAQSNLGAGTIGGLTFAPGLYAWGSSVNIDTDITIAGSATDTWVFQISGNLAQSASTIVHLTGGALAKNVCWQVAGTVAIEAGATFAGIILCQTSITLQSGVTLNGKALAQTQVDLVQAMVVDSGKE